MTSASPTRTGGLGLRFYQFLRKPPEEKAQTIAFYLRNAFPWVPRVTLLPFGACWVVSRDGVSADLLRGEFEPGECCFVERFLRPGMTMLDVGAHHGLYTLLASRCVGDEGTVIAFEPSPRERRRLWLHVILNFCRNVRIERLALGARPGIAQLFVVEGVETGCNSLQVPIVDAPTHRVPVRVATLAEYLEQAGIRRVDLVKLDVEGAELSVLRGAGWLLEQSPRPVFLAEVQETRTRPWGYAAAAIVEYLTRLDYRWYGLKEDGRLERVENNRERYDANFVAVPRERLVETSERMGETSA